MISRLQIPRVGDVDTLRQKVNNIFGDIEDRLRGVNRVETLDVVVSDAADTPFRVQHGLGATPKWFTYIPYSGAILYAQSEDRALWNADYIVLRSDTNDAHFSIRVEA